MIGMIGHSLFTLTVAAIAFYAGVKLTERHHRERDAAVDYARWAATPQPRRFHEGVDMSAPNPIPPTGTRFDKILQPGSEFETRLRENGQATCLVKGGQ